MFLEALKSGDGRELVPIDEAALRSVVMGTIYDAAAKKTWLEVNAPKL